jgi:hypothetical protein
LDNPRVSGRKTQKCQEVGGPALSCHSISTEQVQFEKQNLSPTNKELNLEFSNCLIAKKSKQQLQTEKSGNLKDLSLGSSWSQNHSFYICHQKAEVEKVGLRLE